LGKVSETLSQKQNKNKSAGEVAYMIKCLPTNQVGLGSMPSTRKKGEERRGEGMGGKRSLTLHTTLYIEAQL
jgi:hypothetical protein